jgi:phage N-6-adenine-methyltransferase
LESRSVQHLNQINIQDEYGTDPHLLTQACNKYHILPELDVCTNIANKKCYYYYSKDDDALTKQWNLDFFMNPPYSRVAEFMAYAYKQHKKHNVDALILTYSKTDTKWWHGYVENKAEVHFIQGRLKFLNENGIPPRFCKKCRSRTESEYCENCGSRTSINSAPYPSCWIIYRKNEKRT